MAQTLPKKQENALKFWLNNSDLGDLRPLYEAKLKKNKMVQKTTTTKPEVLRNVMTITKQYLKELNEDLKQSGGPWICGKKFTMADIAWHVSLLRFVTFGCDYLYEDLPEVLLLFLYKYIFQNSIIPMLYSYYDTLWIGLLLHGKDLGSPDSENGNLYLAWIFTISKFNIPPI